MLEVSAVSVAYGQHRALSDAALNVGRGEIVVILGANGAGKTSLMKAIAGIVPCLPGKRVTLSGRDISRLPAHEIVEAGLALGAGRTRHLRRIDGRAKTCCWAPIRSGRATARRRAASRCCRCFPVSTNGCPRRFAP